jgi:gliding motility-associated-like protein
MDISFSYASADITDATNSINPDKLVASRNNTNIGKWLDMYPRGSQTLNTIEIEDVSPSDFFPNWTLLNMPPVLTNLFTPDAFSPNGDGVNDIFAPVFQVDFQVIEYELFIYDRWGRIVFNTKEQGEGWNGISKGTNSPPQVGIYSWIIFVKGYSDNDFSGDGIKEKFTGMVTLIM